MYSVVQEWVFPFIKNLHGDKNSAYSKYMDDAIIKLPTPLLLSKVVDSLDEVNGIMTKNDNTSQYFGCLLLEEFIEKCPLVKEQENIDVIFKEITEYLESAKIECQYDLLNCIISLILKVEKKFKPYAKVCLFKILDYLTDSDSNKRKLAINIVYILALYCKEEIIVVKDNIIEFLNILKEDSDEEVRKVCLETLKIIENENVKDIKKKK
jgi:hypothetical protein